MTTEGHTCTPTGQRPNEPSPRKGLERYLNEWPHSRPCPLQSQSFRRIWRNMETLRGEIHAATDLGPERRDHLEAIEGRMLVMKKHVESSERNPESRGFFLDALDEIKTLLGKERGLVWQDWYITQREELQLDDIEKQMLDFILAVHANERRYYHEMVEQYESRVARPVPTYDAPLHQNNTTHVESHHSTQPEPNVGNLTEPVTGNLNHVPGLELFLTGQLSLPWILILLQAVAIIYLVAAVGVLRHGQQSQ